MAQDKRCFLILSHELSLPGAVFAFFIKFHMEKHSVFTLSFQNFIPTKRETGSRCIFRFNATQRHYYANWACVCTCVCECVCVIASNSSDPHRHH